MVAVSLLGSVAGNLWASDPAGAEALFRQGREAMKRGDYTSACPKFAESQRLDPGGGTLLNLADCEEKQGRLASAWQHFVEASETLPPSDARVAHAKSRASTLEKRVPRLTVNLAADAPNGTKVVRDNTELTRASLGTPLPVDPGRHVIVVATPSREDRRVEVSLDEGQSRTVDVALGPARPGESISSQAPESAARPESQAPTSTASRGSGLRTVGYVLGGLGVVGLGVGSYFAYRASSKDADSREWLNPDGSCQLGSPCADLTHESRAAQTVDIVSFIAGGFALVGGIVLVVAFPPRDDKSAEKHLSLGPMVGPAGGGAVVGGSW